MNLPKFKAKRKKDGEWIYGLVGQSIFGYKPNEIVTTIFSLTPTEDVLEHIVFEIIPETLCQFTGIIDNDGVEIYSDDTRDDGDHLFRIYEIPGGFGIKSTYFADNTSDLTPSDELIMKPIAEPQLAEWLKELTKAIGNYHDIKGDE